MNIFITNREYGGQVKLQKIENLNIGIMQINVFKNGNQTIILRFILKALTFIRIDDIRKVLKIPTVEETT